MHIIISDHITLFKVFWIGHCASVVQFTYREQKCSFAAFLSPIMTHVTFYKKTITERELANEDKVQPRNKKVIEGSSKTEN